jgi:hypothetical protein
LRINSALPTKQYHVFVLVIKFSVPLKNWSFSKSTSLSTVAFFFILTHQYTWNFVSFLFESKMRRGGKDEYIFLPDEDWKWTNNFCSVKRQIIPIEELTLFWTVFRDFKALKCSHITARLFLFLPYILNCVKHLQFYGLRPRMQHTLNIMKYVYIYAFVESEADAFLILISESYRTALTLNTLFLWMYYSLCSAKNSKAVYTSLE